MIRRSQLCALLLLMTNSADAADWSAHPSNQWVLQSPAEARPAPPLKYEGSGAINPATGRWIHFGGHDGIPQGFYLFDCDLGSGTWQQKFPNTSPPGVCCVDGSNTFDVAQGRFVAFPGGSLGHGYQWSRGIKLKQSNAWLYDPGTNEWTNMRPPPYKAPEKYSKDIIGRLNSTATYDARHEVNISFGGQGAGGPTNALFVYDAFANRLEQRHPPESPSARDGVGLCYDTRQDCLVMFGGQYSADERTWLYRPVANRWESYQLDPHPPGKKEGTYSTNPKMAYDSAAGVCLCVVRRGEKSGQPAGSLETWALDVAAMKWTRLNPTREPDPSSSRARNLSYWPEQNLFVLESVSAEKRGPQLWTYRYAINSAERSPQAPEKIRLATHSSGAAESANAQVVLTWQAVNSDGAHYNVYRAKSPTPWDATFTKIATTRAASFTDNDVAFGKIYFYRITLVDAAGQESPPSQLVRTQPPVPDAPVVTIQATDHVDVQWQASALPETVGYNLYRGVAHVDTVKRGALKAWSDNDPEYPAPVVVAVNDITDLQKLNSAPLTATDWVDHKIDLTKSKLSSADYQFAVYAYLVKAVNPMGVESGPSPYALTIPAAPQHVLLREAADTAELRWQPQPGVAGYRIYQLGGSHWEILRLTEKLLTTTSFTHQAGSGSTRYWVVPVDALGQEGEPSSPVWYKHGYPEFYNGPWHQ